MAVTADGKEYARKIANDESPEQAIKVFNDVMRVLLPKTSDNCDMYIFTAHQVVKEWLQVADDLAPYGFRRKAILIWEKDGPGMGDLNSWGMGHELIIFLKKGNRAATAPRRSGVLHVPQLRPKDLLHPHQKPRQLLEMLLKHSTSEGDFIVDPFAGSGSTVQAAKVMGRSAVGIELDEKNAKIAAHFVESDSGGLFG